MKAILQNRYGSPDVLELHQVDEPAVGDHQMRVRVRAASVHADVWHVMRGVPYVQDHGAGAGAPKDSATRQTDSQPRAFRKGDGMKAIVQDEYGSADVLRFDDAETPVEGRGEVLIRVIAASAFIGDWHVMTGTPYAIRLVSGLRTPKQRVRGQDVAGETEAVGAAGGVGSFAVQIAKAFGAHVTGVCSTSKVELVRSIGADEIIDYTREDITDGTSRCDVIFDTAGNRPASQLRRALTPKGTLVLAGGEGGGRWLGMGRVVRAKAMSPFVGQKMTNFLGRPNRKDLVVLKELVEAGKIKPVIGSRYPLRQVPAAVAEIEAGHGRGKVVITV